MLFLAGVVIVAVAILNLPRMRLRRGGRAADLGWMSERWLEELRAAHSS